MTDAPAPAHDRPKSAALGPLAKPVAGVPIWGWIAIVVVVGGGIYFLKSRGGTPAPVEAVTAPAAPTVGNMPMTTTADVTRILTNEQWSQAAQKWLIQNGHPAKESADAVQNYINGEKLSNDQNVLIDAALKAIGPLPQTRMGSAGKVSPLHTPKDGNIFGLLLHGFADLVGLDDEGNPVSPFLLPFINNIIDQGPISGVIQGVNDAAGGNFNLGIEAQEIPTPIGNIKLGGGVSNQGLNLSGGLPGVGSVSGGVSSNQKDAYLAPYTVASGDTLSSISQKVYGSPSGASRIYSANLSKIPNPDRLVVGTVLQIPSATANT